MKLKSWLCEGNDCSKCKYLWEANTSYEYNEWECGCEIKGTDFEDEKCYLIEPFKSIIGFFARRKNNYYSKHQYDGYFEFMDDLDKRDQKLEELVLKEIIKEYELCGTSRDGELVKCNKEWIVKENVWKVRQKYDDFVRKDDVKTLHKMWKEVLKATATRIYRKTFGKIAPYIIG